MLIRLPAQLIRFFAACIGQSNDVAIAPDQFATDLIEGQRSFTEVARLRVTGFHADELQRRDCAVGEPESVIDLIFGRAAGQVKTFDLEQGPAGQIALPPSMPPPTAGDALREQMRLF
ncbi:hypothetical protein XarjCFBP7652_09040 [Xanthomonas arboricola]|nr:hypothetical protein XarjCFBP7652_09040 [Xanthomonas arboricola]